MREIRFRAWHAENKVMVYFDNNEVKKDQYQASYLAALMAGDFGNVLMQFTGLKDKNGVEIYVGDILICKQKNGDTGAKEIVEFKDAMFKCRYRDRPLYAIWLMQDIKVIGNIYENPELLGEES